MTVAWKLQKFDEIVGDIMARGGHALAPDWTKQQKIEFIDMLLAEYPRVSNNTNIGDK